jgi:hypothetical protein
MFEKIVLRKSESGQPISVGQIAEALLYYQNVQLVIDYGTLRALLQHLGVAGVSSLLKTNGLKSTYCEETLGTYTETVGALQVHSYIAFLVSGHESVGHLKTREERLTYLALSHGCTKGQARSFATTFLDRVPVRKLAGNHYVKGGIPKAAKQDLLDAEFRTRAVIEALKSVEGAEQVDFGTKFDVFDTDIGLHVFTDIDLETINRRRAGMSPPLDPITPALLLTYVLNARADLALASFYGGDFATSQASSAIVRLKHADMLKRAGLNAHARDQFHEILLGHCPRLSDAIDSGERSFDEFLKLLDKAAKFKEWLKSVSPDEHLVQRYVRDVTSEDWLQRLPVKVLRYLITLGIGSANPIAGKAAEVADAFILEKVFGGWKPNHFVESRLAPFLNLAGR